MTPSEFGSRSERSIRILARTLTTLVLVASCNRDRAAEPPPPAPAPPRVLPVDAGSPDAPAPGPPPSTERNQIAVGMAYACMHTIGDKLTCWGRSYPDRPTVVAGVEHVAGVVTAQATTCAWTTSGEVFCIDGGPPKRIEGLSDVVEVATDPDHFNMCARRRSGRVACWTDFDKPGPVVDDDRVSGALAIAVAGTTACMRDATGVACWSTVDPKAKLHRIAAAVGTTRLAGGGFRFVALRGGQPPVGWDEQTYTPFALPKLPADVTQIALGNKAGCALGRTVQCWNLADPRSLHPIANVDQAIEIAIGYDLGCARIDHHVSCWGSIGSLGDGTPITTDTPVTVANLDDAVQLEGGADSERTCARRATGKVVCWGSRRDGGTDPVPVDASDVVLKSPKAPRVWSGSYQRGSWTCTKAKHVTCTMTFFGRHQDTDTGPEDRFGNLDDARDLRMPSNNSEHLCVANGAGVVSCFEAFDGADRAVTVDGLTDVIQLAAYGGETCALERAGTVKCWDEAARESSGGKIRTMANITDAVEIAGGNVTACARHKTGKVSCWGSRALLGDNADIHQSSAIVIAGVATP